MTAILWAFIAACSSPTTPDTDLDVSGPEAPRVASPQAKTAPMPLHLEDGACVGDPPAPICEPRHLSTPRPVANPRACDTREDCLPTEFCGAGVCRTFDGEQATLCVQRAWIEGFLCEDAGWMQVIADSNAFQPGSNSFGWLRKLEPGTCLVEDVECTVIDLPVWSHAQAEFLVAATADEDAHVFDYSASEYFSGQERLRQLIDAGCYPIRGASPSRDGEMHPFAHVALWYP